MNFEYFISYLCLFLATLYAAATHFGLSFWAQGDVLRGGFFLILSFGSAAAWLFPLVPKLKPAGIKAMRSVVWLILLFQIYEFIREHFFSSLPLLKP